MRKDVDIIELFLAYLKDEAAYSPLTISTYRADLSHWLEFLGTTGSDLDPSGITVNDMRAWVALMSRKGLSTATIKQRVSAVRSFYRYLVKRHGATSNPAASLQINRRQKSLPKFIDKEEISAVLDTLDRVEAVSPDFETVRDALIVDILYQTGMRVSEILSLTDSRVNMERNEFKVMGKRSKERIIPFGPKLRTHIERYMDIRPFSRSPKQPFLCDTEGNALKYAKVYHAVRYALDGRVSSPKRSPHVLRHTFATDMLNNGADLTSVRQLLGHVSLATTQIYTHVSVNELYDNYYRAHPRARNDNDNENEKNS